MVPPDGEVDCACCGRLKISSARMRRTIVLFVATGAYSGYAPVMPGTAGSAVGLVLYFGIARFGPVASGIFIAALFAVGSYVAGQAEQYFGQRDARRIVVDEVLGLLVALYLLPSTFWFVFLGFVLFRALDIWKPFRRVEEVGGGLGIVADDLIAGVAANVVLQVVRAV